jgi:hypothetical protein
MHSAIGSRGVLSSAMVTYAAGWGYLSELSKKDSVLQRLAA